MSETPKNEEEKQLMLWDLYALSRVNDFFLLPFQNCELSKWKGSAVSMEQYLCFFQQLGLKPFEPKHGDVFSPFHHEIVSVEQSADAAEPISIVRAQWPGLMYGELLFSRSGVRVKGGADFVFKNIAETSTLYFAHRRLMRPTEDLSMGWGSNSQWRTSFRRDYEINGQLFFNVDGNRRLSTKPETNQIDDYGLTVEDRIELCLNRCFIRTDKPHEDLFPYEDRMEFI
ncbi:MAG: hypothetical protein IT342_23910 [Candidatus Melainabacteria bacterium]|nr:hypothetical protein [Candidatus Melainabacteria bacterium]